MKRIRWGIGWLLMLALAVAGATDLARERRIAEQIEEAILVGEPIRLQAGGVAFLAIHAEAELQPRKGAVLLLHGRGAHPDWPDVIHPLRSELPAAGWETLAIQLPVAAADAPPGSYRRMIPEAFPRIDAALDFLAKRQIDTVVIVAHSLGARIAVEYLAQARAGRVAGLVAIGLPITRRGDGKALAALRQLRLPLLDLYGSRDIDPVLDGARARAAAARQAGNTDYRQWRVAGADHFFRGLDEQLVGRVRGELQRVIESRRAPGAGAADKAAEGN